MKKLALLLAPALLLAAREASAYRPFDGTDADVAELGEFELELGPVHYYTAGGAHYLITPGGVLNLGILRDVELVVDFKNFVGLESIPGQSSVRLLDTDILLKYILRRGELQGQSGLSMAVEFGPLLPDINGVPDFGASANLIISHAWKSGALHWNNQLELTRAQNLDVFSSVILEGRKTLPVRPVAEFFIEHEFNAESKVSALFGGIWELSKDFQFDMALRTAREAALNVGEVRLGFTWTFPIWAAKEDEETPAGKKTARHGFSGFR